MLAHDWTRVSSGIFHHFHATWVPEIARSLNAGILPSDYYALAEQVDSEAAPDVITLEPAEEDRPADSARADRSRGDAVEGTQTRGSARAQATERAFEAVPAHWRERIARGP